MQSSYLRWFGYFLLVFVLSLPASAADTPRRSADSVDGWLKQNLEELVKLYLHFHRTPELSFEEMETAARMAEEFKKLGADVTPGVGGHGVVAILKNGPGPKVMLRADMDALPVKEQTNLPYASTKVVTDATGKKVGLMHACGHDIHMTSLLGAARYLADNRDRWSGTLMLIAQPAEERGSGARAMLDDGLFTRFGKPDFAIALHCSGTTPTGSVSLKSGYAMANVDSVDIELYGRGGHGAYPHTTIDPVVQAARLILDLQTVVSREIKPIEPAVITVGSIHAGTKHNIISDSCHLQLTVRSYADDVRAKLLEAIQRKARATAISAGAPEPTVTVSEGTPSLSNDDQLANRIAEVFRTRIGADNVIEQEPVMGGEDFSHFGRNGVPSLLFFLGVVDQKRLDRYADLKTTPPSLHSPLFYPDPERSIETGVITMSSAAIELMPRKN